jgi:hypothetical protein
MCSSGWGWSLASLGDLELAHHPGLPLIEVKDGGGSRIGWLLGWPVDGTRLIRGREHVLPAIGADATDQIEHWLGGLAGRWCFILLNGKAQRLYLDPLGTLAAVYRVDRRIAGSTPTAVHLDDFEAFDRTCAAEPELRANAYFLGRRTRTPDTERLLPNFYLDLRTWRPVRHWPTEPIPDVSVDEAIPRVLQSMGDTLAAVSEQYVIYHGLSAGRDTRLTLAAARGRGIDMRWYTFAYDDPYKRDDVALACRLAKTLGLRHEVLPLRQPTAAMKVDYLRRVGYCANSGKACDQFDGCARHVDLSQAMGIGYGGEAGRGFYWRQRILPRRPDANTLIMAMRLVLVDDHQREAAARWLETVPHFLNTPHLLDLAYLELRAGCWASPQMYGAAPVNCYFVPMSHRPLLRTMMGMPLEARRSQSAIEAMASHGLAEAGDIPYSLPRPASADRRSMLRRGLSRLKRRVVG